jgi:hypothetical protein
VGHISSSKMSLEHIPGDRLNIGVGDVVSLPPVCCGSKQLVHCEENLLTVRAQGYLQFLLDGLCNAMILGLHPWDTWHEKRY